MKYRGKRLTSIKYSEILCWAYLSGLSVFELVDEFKRAYPELEIIDNSVDGVLQGRGRET